MSWSTAWDIPSLRGHPALLGHPTIAKTSLPNQEPFPPHGTEGFAPRAGGGGELKGGQRATLETLVSLLMEPKLSLLGPWGFSPNSCPGANPAHPPAPDAL